MSETYSVEVDSRSLALVGVEQLLLHSGIGAHITMEAQLVLARSRLVEVSASYTTTIVASSSSTTVTTSVASSTSIATAVASGATTTIVTTTVAVVLLGVRLPSGNRRQKSKHVL